MAKRLLFVGGYTEPVRLDDHHFLERKRKGISSYAFDSDTGLLEPLPAICETVNPSYIIADRKGSHLYCVGETQRYGEAESATVGAYRIDKATGGLEPINRQVTGGGDACHLALAPDGRSLFVTNYSGGSVCVFPIRMDGGLEPASCLFRHIGNGPDPKRQPEPHPHQTIIAPDGESVYVADLGLDCLKRYGVDWQHGWLQPDQKRDILGIPGQGVRHGVFDANGGHLYVMTEMKCEVNVYRYSTKEKTAKLMETLACPTKRGSNGRAGAGIRINPNGKWLYCSVRGDDCIYVYGILPDGKLRLNQIEDSGGRSPRELILSEDGRFLLAAHQDSDDLCVHSIDPESGRLTLHHVCKGAYSATTLCLV